MPGKPDNRLRFGPVRTQWHGSRDPVRSAIFAPLWHWRTLPYEPRMRRAPEMHSYGKHGSIRRSMRLRRISAHHLSMCFRWIFQVSIENTIIIIFSNLFCYIYRWLFIFWSNTFRSFSNDSRAPKIQRFHDQYSDIRGFWDLCFPLTVAVCWLAILYIY